MEFNWAFFLDAGIIGAALWLATLIRSKVRFFQKFLIPNSLTAGFLLFAYYNTKSFGMTQDALGELVYHLLSLSFIAMTLRQSSEKQKGKNLYGMSVGVISQFATQATVGMILTIIMMKTFMPGLFPSFGYLLPLGFAQGPGQAFSIGDSWKAFGIFGAGSVGLTFAAIGFLLACFGGVIIINFGMKKGWMTDKEKAQIPQKRSDKGIFNLPEEERPVGSRLTSESEAIDTMTLNIGMIFIIYFLTFLLLKGLTFLLSLAGNLGRELAVNLWGLSYIFAALVTMVMKNIMKIGKFNYIIDNGSLTRISGGCVDMMVAGALGAISVAVVAEYWLPIVIVSVAGALVTIITVPWICSRIFSEHAFHRMLIIYGVSTGTLPTGLALLRVVDPEFKTPVAAEYMFSTALTFLLAIPFVLTINLPVRYWTTGDFKYMWITLGICAAYCLFTIISVIGLTRRNGIAPGHRIWKKDHHI